MKLSYVEGEFLMELIEDFCRTKANVETNKGWEPHCEGGGLSYEEIESLWLRVQDAKFDRVATEA